MPGFCSANASHLVMSASRRASSDWIGFDITAPLAGTPANQLAMVRSRVHRPHSVSSHLRRHRDTFTINELAGAIVLVMLSRGTGADADRRARRNIGGARRWHWLLFATLAIRSEAPEASCAWLVR